MATKAEKQAAKAEKQAEKAEIAQVKAAQAAEIIALKSEGAPKSVIKAENKANNVELSNAKTTLAAPGQQTLLSSGQNTYISGASAYSGDLANRVNTLLTNAANKYDELGIANVSKSGDTTIGLGLDKLLRYDLGTAGNQVTKTIERAQEFVGNTFTPEELAAQGVKIKPVNGVDGLFQYKTGSDGNNVYTFFRQDANGNLVGTGVNRTSTPQDDGGFFSSSLGQILAIGGAVALALTPGGQAFATSVGSTLTGGALTGLQAQALGQAVIRGVSTGAITGDVEKGLIAGAISGAGSALNLSGELGNIFDTVGLGDYKDAFGIIGGNASEASMAAADAAQLAAQGLSQEQIAQTLIQQGTITNPEVIRAASTLASRGVSEADIRTSLGDIIKTTPAPVPSLGAGAFDVAGNPDIIGGTSTGLFAPAVTGTAAGTTAAAATGAATGAATTAAGSAAGSAVGGAVGGTVLDNVLGNTISNLASGLLTKNGLFNNLLNAGIDYARADAIASNLSDQAQQLQRQATNIGQQAQVQFTPYTLTTGTGTTNIGPTGATTTLSPELQALQQQQIGLAGQTFGAINPAQAAQTLYGQVEALAAPTRVREQEALLGRLGARGLLGIGRNLPTVGGGVSAVNPYVESLLSAQETARANQALQATQFGTSEAIRQQGLAQGFQTGALALDTQAMNQLKQAQALSQDQLKLAMTNAEAQRLASTEGLKLAAPLYTAAANIRSGQITGVANQAQNLFGNLFSQPQQSSLQNFTLFDQPWGGTATNPWYG